MEEEEQRMQSLSDIEEQLDAALRRQSPAAAAAPAGSEGADRANEAAIQRVIDAQRARKTGALPAKLVSARSLSEDNFSLREQLRRLSGELRDLQLQLCEAIAVQSRNESECKLATESISEATAACEELRASVAHCRETRDKLAAIELQAPESLSNKDATGMDDKVPKALLWYDWFLGFRVIAGEGGVKFVFNKIDPQRPEKEYSFLISPTLQFIKCDPHVKDIEELAKGLDLNEDLFKFARMAREKFRSSIINGTLPLSLVNRSEDARNETQTPSKNAQLLPAKRGATVGASPVVLRRSPRLEGMRAARS